MKDRDIHFTDKEGNEYYIMVREDKVEVWRNKKQIQDVRFYDDELTTSLIQNNYKLKDFLFYSFLCGKFDYL